MNAPPCLRGEVNSMPATSTQRSQPAAFNRLGLDHTRSNASRLELATTATTSQSARRAFVIRATGRRWKRGRMSTLRAAVASVGRFFLLVSNAEPLLLLPADCYRLFLLPPTRYTVIASIVLTRTTTRAREMGP